MRYEHPLKQILIATRDLWDRAETRPAVRQNFEKMINCRTPTLGAEVYASETEEKLCYHTCKSRACPSCGYRQTLLWQRDLWADLPDIPYVGINLTMPNVLWPIFQRNRRLLHKLAAIGAKTIERWVKVKYGVRVLIIVVPHTFGRHLNFNTHLHILVSAGGLRESESRWIPRLYYDQDAIMHMWRYSVIAFLRNALKAKTVSSDLSAQDLKAFLTSQYERWWNIDIDRFQSKLHFLQCAARYVRRPPIAQRRFVKITDQEVVFWTKDLREKRKVLTQYSTESFVATLAEHVPDRYQHSIRYFGLLAPRSKRRTSAALFLLLRQKKRPRPRRLSWRNSLRKYFKVDPLVDRQGQPLRWVGRLKTAKSTPCISSGG